VTSHRERTRAAFIPERFPSEMFLRRPKQIAGLLIEIHRADDSAHSKTSVDLPSRGEFY